MRGSLGLFGRVDMTWWRGKLQGRAPTSWFLPPSRVRGVRLTRPEDHRNHSPERFRGVPGMAELELMQGTLDVLVLKALVWGPRHGYAVAQWLKDTSGARIVVEDRALYIGLHRLEDRGLIESEWGLSENNRKARYYRLTTAGRRALRAKTEYWDSYAAAVFRVLRAADA